MHKTWKEWLEPELSSAYYSKLEASIHAMRNAGVSVFPPDAEIFSAFSADPRQTRVVIIGQDPYIRPGQAHGYSFSVPQGVKTPPSLLNIYKEIAVDLPDTEIDRAVGCLLPWAQQGVFLLNNVLTVEEGKSDSHKKLGWSEFTTSAIKALNVNCEHLVFMLWGGHAKNKAPLIDQTRHLVLQAAHPCGMSAYRGFFGCAHFSKANRYLEASGKPAVDWSIR